MALRGILILALAASLLLGACSLSFDVELIDQKTALENQLLTEMRKLREDLILLSEVREARSAAPDSDRWEAFLALQDQLYNQDDLDRLKSLGYVGETVMGQVAVAPGADGKMDPADRDLMGRIVAQENRDRLIIMRYLLKQSGESGAGDLEKVQRVMGAFNRDRAAQGAWVQDSEGRWLTQP